MSKIAFVFEIIIKLITLLFVYMFARQLFDAVTGDSTYLFFEIIFLTVWGVGALIFGVVGLLMGKARKRNKEDEKE